MQPPPLVGALDANRDGVIDEKEIKQAPEALRKLDKNNDGKLTMEELRPPRPEGDRADGQRHAPEGERRVGPRPGDHATGDRDGERSARRGPRPPEGR
jgi:hypothetical protein